MPPDFDSVRPGPRYVQWRSDTPSTLIWVEALDGGDPKKEMAHHDQLYSWNAPFNTEPQKLMALQYRLSDLRWGRSDLAWVSESWWKTRKTRTHHLNPETAHSEVLFERSSEDRYGDPGSPSQKRLPNGHAVLRIHDESVLLLGEGASPQGNQPFVDSFSLKDKKPKRLWQSQPPNYESVLAVMDDEGKSFLTTRETVTEPPNLYRNTGEQLTRFSHPAPELKGISKELIKYKRADGLDLSGTLYLPPGYDPKKDGPLPVLMWAYPDEYKSAAAAGQVKGSPHRFVSPFWGGPVFFAMRGYAVLDNPGFPIVGEGKKEPNDTYLEQLKMDAKAAIDELARRGVGDPKRCCIGGHSYGAFTTANLLAHTDLFRAGIARSGAYNRTLTPFGFQSEERTFWDAPDTYIKMSPFTHADKINEPLLLIHGAEDANPGTFPMQSERLYQAVKGLGGKARLVMLPKESHSYEARESVLHCLYEMDRWLEQHVK